jgi:DNA replication protein DnaC
MAPLSETLKTLGLHHTATHLDDLVALATKRRWSPIQLLEHLVATEQLERTRRSLERRLARARIGRFTPMADFDWAWPTRIDRAAVEAVLRLDFLAAGRNLVLVASQGLGKTMIAQNIAQQAVLAGHRVLFLTAAQLLLDLGGQDSARALARRLQDYSQQGLLVVDRWGICPTTRARPTSSSRSSAAALKSGASSSRPTCASATGRRSSPTPPR